MKQYSKDVANTKVLTRDEEKDLFNECERLGNLLLYHVLLSENGPNVLLNLCKEMLASKDKMKENLKSGDCSESTRLILQECLDKADNNTLWLLLSGLHFSRDCQRMLTDTVKCPDVSAANSAIDRVNNEIVKHNLRLVYRVSNGYRSNKLVDVNDVIQDGCMGLMRAVELYDARCGANLCTYAMQWIKHSIARGIATHGRTIRVPVDVSRENGACVNTETVSLEAFPHSSSVLLDERLECAETLTTKSALASAVRKLAATLTEKEERVLRLRFGIDCREHNLEEIGVKMGFSRENARQIEAKCLKKLREPGRFKRLAAFI